ncbi:hypothetical protein AN191_18070 [Loktanella sp. 5RATIMAR09]|nr:hypothetical protein AN191_18070 [Loktanella sp. 5RATIMAR09]
MPRRTAIDHHAIARTLTPQHNSAIKPAATLLAMRRADRPVSLARGRIADRAKVRSLPTFTVDFACAASGSVHALF